MELSAAVAALRELMVSFPPSFKVVPELNTTTAVSGRILSDVVSKIPPLREIFLPKVLAPVSRKVPNPFLIRPALVPARDVATSFVRRVVPFTLKEKSPMVAVRTPVPVKGPEKDADSIE